MKKLLDSLKKFPFWVWSFPFLAISVPILLNACMCRFHIPSGEGLENPEWLGFWGSYLGGALGCVPALLALYETKRQSIQQHDDQKNNQRLSVMPVLKFELIGNIPLSEAHLCRDYVIFDFDETGSASLIQSNSREFTNCNFSSPRLQRRILKLEIANYGLGPALYAELHYGAQKVQFGGFSVNSPNNYALLLTSNLSCDTQISFDFEVTFLDIYGHPYSQIFKMEFFGGIVTIHPASSPVLISE